VGDYNVKLSQLHQRVWQGEFGLPAEIDRYGWIQFGPTPLGELSIILREYSQEGMELRCTIFEDYSDKAPNHGDVLRICNAVNELEDAKLQVSDTYCVVQASIYLILAEPGKIPDERLLHAVALPAITRIKAAKTAFFNELEKLG